jgi:hypothetical protein
MWSLDYIQEPVDSENEIKISADENKVNLNIPTIKSSSIEQKSSSSGGESDTEFSTAEYMQNVTNKKDELACDKNESNKKEIDEEYIVVNKIESNDQNQSKLKPGLLKICLIIIFFISKYFFLRL